MHVTAVDGEERVPAEELQTLYTALGLPPDLLGVVCEVMSLI